jgi:hypothetical protein
MVLPRTCIWRSDVLRGAVDAGSAQDPGGLAARAFRGDPVHDPQRCSCGRPTTKAAADFDHRMSGVSVSPLELDRALLAAAAHRDGATTNDAVLVTVAAALHQILLRDGSSSIQLSLQCRSQVVAREADGDAISLARCSSIPATGELGERFRRVEAAVHAHKATATGRPPDRGSWWIVPVPRHGSVAIASI